MNCAGMPLAEAVRCAAWACWTKKELAVEVTPRGVRATGADGISGAAGDASTGPFALAASPDTTDPLSKATALASSEVRSMTCPGTIRLGLVIALSRATEAAS
jgi:hypothetical protein